MFRRAPAATVAAVAVAAALLVTAAHCACTTDADCNSANCFDCKCPSPGSACACADGWNGTACQTPFCVNQSQCSNHGTCVMTLHSITCECDVAHTGDRCQTAECQMQCVHGGQPNANCTACEGCYPGWAGPRCDVFTNGTSPTDLLAAYQVHFTNCMATANKTIGTLQQTYNPIPGWREVANSYDGVSGSFKIPFVGFSFEQGVTWASGNGTQYAVPDQLVIDTGFVPGATPQPPQPFRLADEPTAFQVGQFNNGSGRFGWLGGLNDPTELYTAYYSQGMSLAVYQTYYPLYSLNLTSALSHVSSAGRGDGNTKGGGHRGAALGAANVTLSRYAAAALESLPPTYDISTQAVFELFINTFGTSMATVSLRGGGTEDVVAWASCLWKGTSPQTQNHGNLPARGTRDCVLDEDNYAAMVAGRNFSGRSTVVSSVKYGGDPTVTDPAAWALTIANAPVVLSYAMNNRLSALLPPSMNDTAAALDQAISAYEQQALRQVQTAAAEAKKSQLSQARGAVFVTDSGGECKGGQLAPGQSWDVQCGPSIAPFQSTADMNAVSATTGADAGTATLVIEGGGDEVSCGCSDLQVDVGATGRRKPQQDGRWLRTPARPAWRRRRQRRRLQLLPGEVLLQTEGADADEVDTEVGDGFFLDDGDDDASGADWAPELMPTPAPPAPAPGVESHKPSPVVPKDMKCRDFKLKLDFPGNTVQTIAGVSDPGRCCDLCDLHHSCLYWTYHFKKDAELWRRLNVSAPLASGAGSGAGSDGKTCELKLAKSDTQCCDPSKSSSACPHDCRDVIVSGSRNGHPPAQDWAHFCFDCSLPSAVMAAAPARDAASAVARGFPLFQA